MNTTRKQLRARSLLPQEQGLAQVTHLTAVRSFIYSCKLIPQLLLYLIRIERLKISLGVLVSIIGRVILLKNKP